VSLPALDSYSSKEVEEACSVSSALRSALHRSKSSDSLYGLRYKSWAQAALASYFARAPASEVCKAWSQTADSILQQVAIELNAPPELALFAFGKLGSHELNLSSDIDVILVGLTDNPEHLIFLRKFQARLSESGSLGFLFRVDFDLRPGGKLGPLIPTVEQFTDFYGNYGETWERLAFIRLRPIWGNHEVIQKIQEFSRRFVFRKHLDFSLLEDLKSLRAKVHDHYWKRTTEDQTDLKLGIGGIRDLELFTHALQVVHGGKDSRLHASDTNAALESFSKYNILPESDVSFLKNFYWELRALENWVQAIDDRQTHILKKGLPLPPALMATEKKLIANMKECDRIVSGLLGKISANPQRLPENLELQEEWLEKLGFSKQEIQTVWPEILAVPIFSRNRERDLDIRNRFLFQILQKLALFAEPNLSRIKDFLVASKAKTSFFSMLISSAPLLEMLAHMLSLSPYLAKIICARPELLDSLVMRNIEDVDLKSIAMDTFLDSLAERRMLTEILTGAELLGGENLEGITKSLTQTADDICSMLLKKICLEIGTSETAVSILALGKWGGEELGFHSDLDCIFVTQKTPTEMDHKVVRRFINRLTETHRGGSLYSIDTRLKMTGAGGILITSFTDLKSYLISGAHSWERQAYLRSRWIGNSKMKPVKDFCRQMPTTTEDLSELNRIRSELTKNSRGELDLKYSEGGMIDTEFSAQIALLLNPATQSMTSTYDMINALAKVDSNWNSSAEQLLSNYRLMRLVEQLKKLLSEESSTVIATDQTYLISISHRLKMRPDQLALSLKQALSSQLEILKKLDPRRTQS
jgi:[glutamine synthetase] adenylyltransferase / [glutamine synthetase]-adenylyl-L-tyrosine phosphorylase